jgi:hypothetical protein
MAGYKLSEKASGDIDDIYEYTIVTTALGRRGHICVGWMIASKRLPRTLYGDERLMNSRQISGGTSINPMLYSIGRWSPTL